MTEPEQTALQVKIPEAAIMMNYSQSTIRRMLDLDLLPSTGRGRLRRIPVYAILAKIKRMEEGEDPWEGKSKMTRSPAASVVAVPSGPIAMVKRGTPTKTKPAKSADIVQFRTK